mmetsp:Transcript_2329/g.3259  ORF Transcript_2329/g.3259 Transcript_2329/m.3259 type:complete len:80 (-) Transcript_2329:757-996(-)
MKLEAVVINKNSVFTGPDIWPKPRWVNKSESTPRLAELIANTVSCLALKAGLGFADGAGVDEEFGSYSWRTSVYSGGIA